MIGVKSLGVVFRRDRVIVPIHDPEPAHHEAMVHISMIMTMSGVSPVPETGTASFKMLSHTWRRCGHGRARAPSAVTRGLGIGRTRSRNLGPRRRVSRCAMSAQSSVPLRLTTSPSTSTVSTLDTSAQVPRRLQQRRPADRRRAGEVPVRRRAHLRAAAAAEDGPASEGCADLRRAVKGAASGDAGR